MKNQTVENKVNQLNIVLQQLLEICGRGKKSNENECENIYQRIKRIIEEKDRIYTDLVNSVNDEKIERNKALREQENNLNSQYLMQLENLKRDLEKEKEDALTKQKHDIENGYNKKYNSLESKYNSLEQANKKLQTDYNNLKEALKKKDEALTQQRNDLIRPYFLLESKYNSLEQENKKLQTGYNHLKEALKKKDKELKKQREDLEKDKKDALQRQRETLTIQKDEALEQQESNIRLQYNTLLENQKQHYQTNYNNMITTNSNRISSYKRVIETEKSNLINTQIKISYILMYLYKKKYKSILSDIQPYINEITIPSIILTNNQSSNRVGIDLNILSYRDYDNEKSNQKNVGDVIASYEKEKISKSIAMTLLRKEYNESIFELVNLKMKTVFIHDLYALYLKIFYEKEKNNEEMDKKTYIAGLYENNMEILEVTYNRESKTIKCIIEYEEKYSFPKLKELFIPEGEKIKLKDYISNNQEKFNSGLIKMEVDLEVYFGNMTENKVYLHLPNYTKSLLEKKEIEVKNVTLDFSNDSSEGALKFADSFYSKINLL